MSDLTTYRISTNPDRDNVDITEYWVSDHEQRDAGWLVPDTRLQAIADILPDLLELAESGIGYTPDYFVEKWGMDKELAEIKAKIKDALTEDVSGPRQDILREQLRGDNDA
jgi:hypothetical protein